jgi:hypothetical protein
MINGHSIDLIRKLSMAINEFAASLIIKLILEAIYAQHN